MATILCADAELHAFYEENLFILAEKDTVRFDCLFSLSICPNERHVNIFL